MQIVGTMMQYTELSTHIQAVFHEVLQSGHYSLHMSAL
jgi:hypothetical protein